MDFWRSLFLLGCSLFFVDCKQARPSGSSSIQEGLTNPLCPHWKGRPTPDTMLISQSYFVETIRGSTKEVTFAVGPVYGLGKDAGSVRLSCVVVWQGKTVQQYGEMLCMLY